MVFLPTDARLMSPGQPSSLHWGQLDICQRTMTRCITEERGKVCGLQEVTVCTAPHAVFTLCPEGRHTQLLRCPVAVSESQSTHSLWQASLPLGLQKQTDSACFLMTKQQPERPCKHRCSSCLCCQEKGHTGCAWKLAFEHLRTGLRWYIPVIPVLQAEAGGDSSKPA